MKPEFRRIAVLAGGPSCEREISLISGQAVLEALKSKGFSVFLLDPGAGFVSELKSQGVSIVFIALHGVFGEDGTVQRLLDEAEILYTGSGVEISERAFDKSKAQALFRGEGVLVPDFVCVQKNDALASSQRKLGSRLIPAFAGMTFDAPFVVKPARAGSSVGITLVSDKKELKSALERAFRYSDTVLVEQYIRGRELTVGILGDEALPIVEIIPKRKFYDYEAKYGDSGTRYEFPAKLTDAQAKKVSAMAMKAYRVLGGEVMGRADIRLDAKGEPYVLELNTIPGLTGESLLPKAAKAKGIDFPELCVRILELSLTRKKHGQTIKN